MFLPSTRRGLKLSCMCFCDVALVTSPERVRCTLALSQIPFDASPKWLMSLYDFMPSALEAHRQLFPHHSRCSPPQRSQKPHISCHFRGPYRKCSFSFPYVAKSYMHDLIHSLYYIDNVLC